MDYLICDRIVSPPTDQQYFSEKIVYLPNSYLPSDCTRDVGDVVFTREELGLPSTGFVFCCFNGSYKIGPRTFDSWMRILTRVPDGVLWLSASNLTAMNNLRGEAARRGVDPGRLVFAGRMPSAKEHLARHRTADLFLDTLPYNAHATAIDALWAGLPVLTLIGEAFPGRVGASLLTAIDLQELIASTAGEYEAMAVQLAEDPRRLADLRQRLALNRLSAPLFDSVSFTRHLEAGFVEIMGRFWAGLPPEHIYVSGAAQSG
jgi:predicted O-linked N-acetylglucosamine transferase (SPINDLY family)